MSGIKTSAAPASPGKMPLTFLMSSTNDGRRMLSTFGMLLPV